MAIKFIKIFIKVLTVSYCSLSLIHFTREIIVRIEAPNDDSLKEEDINSMEILDYVLNDLCNNDTLDNTTKHNEYTTLGPCDVPPSHAGFREVKLEDLEAGMHVILGCSCYLLFPSVVCLVSILLCGTMCRRVYCRVGCVVVMGGCPVMDG